MGCPAIKYNSVQPQLLFVKGGLFEAKKRTKSYRFGFNGQEKDNEVSGAGNSNTAEYWQYDTRLGRRWNVDPKSSIAPGWSPYRAFFDNPIYFVDPNGDYEEPKNGFQRFWNSVTGRSRYNRFADFKEKVSSAGGKVSNVNYEGEKITFSVKYSYSAPNPDYNPSDFQNNFETLDVIEEYLGFIFEQDRRDDDYDPDKDFESIYESGLANGDYNVFSGKYVNKGPASGRMEPVYPELWFVPIPPVTKGAQLLGNVMAKALGRNIAMPSSKILSWGNNAKGHLIKHADALGFGGYTPQQLQMMLPQLRGAANKLLNSANPALTRVGQWHGHQKAMMYISNGKMLVTEANGTFITLLNKTSNNWYNLAKPIK